jgi:hypothetical protein
MRLSLFEQAAVEASICAKEVDGEIEELQARKKVLEGLMQHLSMALPVLGSKTGSATPAVSSEEAAPAPFSSGDAVPEGTDRADSWRNFISSIATPSTASGETMHASGVAALSFANPTGIRERVLG